MISLRPQNMFPFPSGTLISEWDAGYDVWYEILSSSEDDRDHLIEVLCRITDHYGFDGWLFNVENRIDPSKVPLLIDFVRKLAQATKKVKLRDMG